MAILTCLAAADKIIIIDLQLGVIVTLEVPLQPDTRKEEISATITRVIQLLAQAEVEATSMDIMAAKVAQAW